MTIDISPATADDAVALAACAAVTFPLACPADSRPEDIRAHIRTHLSAERFAVLVDQPGHTILCIREADRIGGWSMIMVGRPTDDGVRTFLSHAPAVELSKFYVHPDHHGSGASGKLMEATLDLAAASGHPGIWLGVNQENARAIRFYEKNGFRRVGTKRFRLGERYEDDFILEQPLPSPMSREGTPGRGRAV